MHRWTREDSTAELLGRSVPVSVHIVDDQFWAYVDDALGRNEQVLETGNRAIIQAQITGVDTHVGDGLPWLFDELQQADKDLPIHGAGRERLAPLEPPY